MSVRTPESRCPTCLRVIDGATDPFNDKTPSPDDRTICVYCSCWSVFDDDLRLRPLTDDELAEMADDPRVNMLYQFAHQYRQEHP